MMQIQTVLCPIERAQAFDDAVNTLLLRGWRITERSVIPVCGEPSDAGGYPVMRALYAALEREAPPAFEEVTG